MIKGCYEVFGGHNFLNLGESSVKKTFSEVQNWWGTLPPTKMPHLSSLLQKNLGGCVVHSFGPVVVQSSPSYP